MEKYGELPVALIGCPLVLTIFILALYGITKFIYETNLENPDHMVLLFAFIGYI